MTATVKITKNYGVEAIYPVYEASQTVAQIAVTKTLTRNTIALMKRLGYDVQVEQEAL